jgi:opacity protein-like surface antigen
MRFRLTLAIIAILGAVPAMADGVPVSHSVEAVAPGRGVYVGVFGGGGYMGSTDIAQRGTAYFLELDGGPLAVDAKGNAGSGGVGFVGGQVGYEFSHNALMLPALELEGFYLGSGTRNATVNNPTGRLEEHTFEDSFKVNNAVFLANMVLGFRSSYPGVTPYVGVGIGAARVGATGADSLQIAPPEAGVNHFNSDTSSEAWTFAGQVKAGVRLALSSNAYVFGEYRYLYIGSTDQTFGSTVFPGHAETSPWTVEMGATSYSLATAGIGVNF